MRSGTCCLIGILVFALAGTAALAGQDEPPAFVRKPTAKQAGQKVAIEFAVDRPTDVAVFIENGAGKVVRHLVAGVLGDNPPAPLRPGLAQSIEWDGLADYGKPAGAGPFKVRVALGVGATYDRVLYGDPHTVPGPQAMGVGPDGTLYATIGAGIPGWNGDQMVAFNRDGSYQRMMMPYPAGLPAEEVTPFGTFELDGRQVPLVKYVQRLSFYDTPGTPRKANMAVTGEGHVYFFVSAESGPGIAVLNRRGGCPQKQFIVAPIVEGTSFASRSFMALADDGKQLFLTGLVRKKAGSAVYRVKLPERTEAPPFFGDPAKSGKGETLLGGVPHGVSCDGKGRLLIADFANNRVVAVSQANGKYVGEFPVEKPDCVAVNPKTGEVFVTSFAGDNPQVVTLIKFASPTQSGGWQAPRELARLPLRFDGNAAFPGTIVGDFGGPTPIIWAGGEREVLLRVEDRGDKLEAGKSLTNQKAGSADMLDVTVDRFREDPEIYSRVAYSFRGNWWDRYNETTGEIERLAIPGLGRASGAQLVVDPDGNLIMPAYPQSLLRFNRKGEPYPWPEGSYPEQHLGKQGEIQKTDPRKQIKHGTYAPVSMTHCCHTVGVRHDGSVFVLEAKHPGGRPPKALHQYAPTGRRVTTDPIIWMVSDGAVGPKFDPQGNIYIAEIVKPVGQPYPDEFKKIFPEMTFDKGRPRPDSPQDNVANMYGSVVKFSPRGGMIDLTEGQAPHDIPFDGQPKLEGLKTVDMSYYSRTTYKPVKVTGAEWVAPGYSHVEIRACNCQTSRFDVDEFGRVWLPDLNRFRVSVIDTNANPITHFGGYGNAESTGAGSPVIDPASGKPRPRRPDDPKDLASPFAQPDIAFSWLTGVAVSDKFIYTGDALNRRVLKIKMTYAAESTCDVTP